MTVEERVVELLRERGPMTSYEIGLALGSRYHTYSAVSKCANSTLYRMVNKGVITRDRSTKPLKWVVVE